MSEAAALPATLSNFDAIVASKTAALEASSSNDEAPDTTEAPAPERTERDTEPDFEPDEQDEAPELDDEDEGDDEERNDPTVEPVTQELRAPFKAFREAIKSGRATPELMKAIGELQIDIDLPGGRTSVAVKDLPAGFMRTARMHRELAKTREDQGRAQNIIEVERARTAAWRQNDQELERGLEVMGCTQAAEKMFWRWAQRKHQYMSATPEERQRIDYIQNVNRERAQERAQFMEMQRQLEQARQSGQGQQMDEFTQQATRHVEQNMDRVLGAALKAAGGGKLNDSKRLDWVNQVAELGRQGFPLEEAMKEAAENIADIYRERREKIAADERAQQAARREVPAKRAPAGTPPQQRGSNGQFQSPAPRRTKQPPTAAEFGRRFGL